MAPRNNISLSESLQNQINRGKKRQIHVEKWKSVKSKMLRAQGQQYVTRKGAVVPSKVPPDDGIVCRCKAGCEATKLPIGYKLKIFTDFYKLDYNQQTYSLVNKCINLHEPTRPKIRQAAPRRKCSVFYYLPFRNDRLRVCKQTLVDTYKITARRLQWLVEKMQNETDITDQRGTHNNRPRAISNNLKELIKDHINSFPKQESHYSREKSSNEYLSEDLNVSIMYKLFLEKYPDQKISMRTYRAEFIKLKLRFGAPRSDTCTICDKQYIKLCSAETEEERNKITQETTMHQMKAKLGYSNLKSAKVTPNLYVVFTDLQQVLFCPTLKHSSVFYQRQLSCYNYAIHDAASNKVAMMFWNETIGHRGSTDISSCFLRYVKEYFEVLQPGEERKLIIWSDRCIGQNNNWRMISMYKLLIELKYFTEVHQKFLSTGHSFLPCDRDFAQIERQKKRNYAMVLFDWVEIIANARPSQPYTVICMTQMDFKDLSQVESSLYKDPKLKITQSVWYKLTADAPNIIQARESHNIIRPWVQYNIAIKKKRGRTVVAAAGTISHIEELPFAYAGPLPIKPEKKTNLLDMCQYLMRAKDRAFYENITTE